MIGDQRFVISARVIGAVQRHTPKLKVSSTTLYKDACDAQKALTAFSLVFISNFIVATQTFMISASWSDQTEVIVYRSFQDFRKFHVSTLSVHFPHYYH